MLIFSEINEMLKNVKKKWTENLFGMGQMLYLCVKFQNL